MAKKVPLSTTDSKNVVDKKHGMEFCFAGKILNEKYPPIFKSKNAYIPYLSYFWPKEKLGDVLPFGVKFGMKEAELRKVLGEPNDLNGDWVRWHRLLDSERNILFNAEEDYVSFTVAYAADITVGPYQQRREVTGIFIYWLISHIRNGRTTFFCN